MLFLTQFIPTLLAASSLLQAAVAVRRDNGKHGVSFSGFVDALRKHNLTDLADNYEKVSKTDSGQAVVDMIENGGELTVLAPEDCAFDSGHSELDARDLLYHQIWGSIDKGFKGNIPLQKRVPESHDVIESGAGMGIPPRDRRRQSPAYQVQVIDQTFTSGSRKRWYDKSVEISRAVGSVKVVDRFEFEKIIILIIKKILGLPEKVSGLLCKPLIKDAPNGFKKFSGGLEKTGLIDKVEDGYLLTMFVPTDESLGNLDKLPKDDLYCLLENHFFFGRRAFSPLFDEIGSATAESGKKLTFSSENGVHYVCCGQSKARLVRRDVISDNGVLHIIDKPLKCDGI